MKQLSRAIMMIFVSLFAFTMSMSAFSSATPPVSTSLAPMLQNITPAIVNIRAKIKITDFNTLREIQKQRNLSNDDQPLPDTFGSVGSGVIVDAQKGYILTNAHVVANAQTIIITLADGRHFSAKMIGLDKPSDVALLQIKAKNLTAIPLANSNDLKVGDFVAAIGNPFGLNQSVTSGIVSAVGRNTLGIENYENFIQTDAPINPGNSGGALINMQGQLVGINTAILAPDRGSIGIGFAIPANMIKSVMLQLIEYGNVKRGILGIGAQDITPELGNAFNIGNVKGAAVTMVQAQSPAEQAGVHVGDIITAINATPTKDASDVINTIGFLRVDSKITMNVLRNTKPLTLNITLSDPSKRKQLIEQEDPFFYGVALKNFSLLSPVHGNIHGVLIVSADEETKAWQSDLRPGDVITSVNQEKITSIAELKAATAKANKTLLLNILRGPSAIFLVVDKES
jgi:serine protease Do